MYDISTVRPRTILLMHACILYLCVREYIPDECDDESLAAEVWGAEEVEDAIRLFR